MPVSHVALFCGSFRAQVSSVRLRKRILDIFGTYRVTLRPSRRPPWPSSMWGNAWELKIYYSRFRGDESRRMEENKAGNVRSKKCQKSLIEAELEPREMSVRERSCSLKFT